MPGFWLVRHGSLTNEEPGTTELVEPAATELVEPSNEEPGLTELVEPVQSEATMQFLLSG